MVVMDMARERLKLMLSQDTEAMDMVVMVMAEAMEVMVDTEAMEVMDMARERLKLMLNQVTEAMDMVVMDMAEAMVVMEDMDMAKDLLMLSQVIEAMDMVVMVMAEAMVVMVDTEAMDMESKSADVLFYFHNFLTNN